MSNGHVLAMYDVRGIQNYIFKTAKLRDSIGASEIVATIVRDALFFAVEKQGGISSQLEWISESGPLPYNHTDEYDVQVLYIGGGNAYVKYSSGELAVDISKAMAKYTIENTYSLQLATAITDITEDYAEDYKSLINKMTNTKDNMSSSAPVGAFPIVKTEKKTGYPLKTKELSAEVKLKREAESRIPFRDDQEKKKFENYITEKYVSSLLAVVHIDGNNMSLRIREMIKGIQDYSEAINLMRSISYKIDSSYKKVFCEMQDLFNGLRKDDHYNVLRVVSSGDDITYVCNANVALATVEYFCNNISKYGMGSDDDPKGRFSVCAGIAFFGSHFPFNTAYSVAEACCDSAKDRAKKQEHKSGELVANWMDFQFCRSIHAADLDKIRQEEYVTARGENLLRRPYYMPADTLEKENKRFSDLRSGNLGRVTLEIP